VKQIPIKASAKFALLLLVRIPSFLPKRLLLNYWIFLSNLQFLFYRKDRIKRIQELKVEGSNVLLISTKSGEIYVQDIERISRFWKGADYAFERLYNQYVSPKSQLREKLDSQDPDVILDIGANIGEFSIFCARHFTKSTIYAFEPDPIAYICLQRNIRNFGLQSRVSVWNIALSNKNEKHSFYISSRSADSSLIEPSNYTKVITVDTWRLDNFLKRASVVEVGLLKMDAEGFEPEVIEGLGSHISNCNALTIDVSPERAGVSTLSQTLNFFAKDNFLNEVIQGEGNRMFLTIISKKTI
jgi:FkbM family methyltransferase